VNRPPVQARWTPEDAALRVVFEGLGRELRCVRAPQLRIRLSMMQHAHRHEVVHLVASAQPRRHNVVHAEPIAPPQTTQTFPSRRRTAARIRFHWPVSRSGRDEPLRVVMSFPCASPFSTLEVEKDAKPLGGQRDIRTKRCWDNHGSARSCI
jgi:hypothetical protein